MTLAIFGPTVTGKTTLAISIAKKYNGALISADSRQIYRHLDIGSGKIQPNFKVKKNKGYWFVNGIKVLGFDIKEPGESFSAWEFSRYAKVQIDEIKKTKKIPIIVGGTGFYIKTLLYGIDASIQPNQMLRINYSTSSAEDLYKVLKNINEEKAMALNESDKQNPRRLIRALEIEAANSTIGNAKPKSIAGGKRKLILGLTAPNYFLYEKANKWLDIRLAMGMEDEVRELIRVTAGGEWLISLGLEYRWITKFVLGQISRDIALERLRGDIHALIRRQKTYLRQFPDITIFDITKPRWETEVNKIIGERFAHLT